MLCDYILQYASATLAGEKAGSLFRIPRPLWDNKEKVLPLLHSIHLQCIPVQIYKQSILLYIYNPYLLNIILQLPENISFLIKSGYSPFPDTSLSILLHNIRRNRDFPHEVGLFLGYPLHDVEGFIINQGKNCLYNKYWKVYHNVEQAKQKFARYDAYRECCKKARHTGASFEEILHTYAYKKP